MSQQAIALIKDCLETQNPYLDLGNCGLRDADVAEGTEIDRLLRQCTHIETMIWSSYWEEWTDENGWRRKDSQNQGSDNFFITHPPAISSLLLVKSLALGGRPGKGWEIHSMDFVAALTRLQHLWLAYNEISEIKGLEGCSRLNSLSLHYNKITKIKGLEGLTVIKSLDLHNNQISEIKGLEGLTRLNSLYLSRNQISEIKGLEGLTGLNSLYLSRNQISEIKGLQGLTGLSSLYLSDNQISEIKGLEGLTGLSSLYLSDNQISEIKGLEGLTGLKSLHLSGNQIREIKGLEDLARLKSLNLSHNKISDIKALENLTGLNSLDLWNNQISDIKGLEGLPGLMTLKISYNRLQYCAPLAKLSKLSNLVLHGNPLRDAPQALLGDNYLDNCLYDMENWWHETRSNTRPNTLVKMQLIGNGNVGKSSVVEALTEGRCEKEFTSTHGVRMVPLQFPLSNPSKPISFQVWDFGGQEIYHGTHRLFMQSQSVQVVVFDAQTEAEALGKTPKPDRIVDDELVLDQPLRHYLQLCRQQSPEGQLLVLQNKADKGGGAAAEQAALAGVFDAGYYTVSATTGRGIDTLRAALAEAGRDLLHYGMPMPASWLAVQQYFLDNLAGPTEAIRKLLSYTEFENICRQQGVMEKAIPSLLKLLHHTGIVYENKQLLGETIIADQRWALDAIYAPLQRGSPFYYELRDDFKGRVRAKTLFYAFGAAYSSAEKWLFLQFMQSCGLCYRLHTGLEVEDENSYYIFPRFLPATETPAAAELWRRSAAVQWYEWQGDYLDYYRIQQFIVELGNKTALEYVWQNGLLVTTPAGMFRLEAQREKALLKLGIEAPAVADYLLLIMEAFNRDSDKAINGRWTKDGVPVDLHALRTPLKAREERPADVAVEKSVAETLSASLADRQQQGPRRLVVSYASEDRDARKLLEKYASEYKENGQLDLQFDEEVVDGTKPWDKRIEEMFMDAHGFVLLVSSDYQYQKEKPYIWQHEIPIILERHSGEQLFCFCLMIGPVKCHERLHKIPAFKGGKESLPETGYARKQFMLDFVEQIIVRKFLNIEYLHWS